MNTRKWLVAACDAAGAIGPKVADTEPATAESVGYFCTRVTLIEMLTVGATPCMMICNFSVEREPTGRDLLRGARRLLQEEGLADRVATIISSENNFATEQTGVGVTLLGFTHSRKIPWNKIRQGDEIYQVGLRRVGREARIGDPSMVSPDTVRRLVAARSVREAIPVGSGGISGELKQLELRGVAVLVVPGISDDDLKASGGPATALLVAARPHPRGERPLPSAGLRLREPVRLVGHVTSVVARSVEGHHHQ